MDYKNEAPWNDDEYMKTIVEDDPALQFDVEEDLDLLDSAYEINNNIGSESTEMHSVLKKYEKIIKEKDNKIEELIEMVDKFRYLNT